MEGSDDPLLGEFVSEALEHLSTSEECLLVLEDDPSDPDSLNALFRSFHTIKGGAGILDLGLLSRFAHLAESLLDQARTGVLSLEGEPLELAYGSVDVLQGLIEGLNEGLDRFPVPEKYAPTQAALERLTTQPPEAAGEKAPAPPSGAPEAGASASADPADSTPAPKPASDEVPAAAPQSPKTTVAVDAGASAAPETPTAQAPAAPKAGGANKRKVARGTVKVDTERLDSMVDLVGELVIATAMVRQEAEAEGQFARSVGQLAKVTTELQQIAMSMRMVPLKATFQKAARIVRDVAVKCSKRVNFRDHGGETELDRNVVDQLGDPLIHMLRNAVDHGLESTETRLANGKSEKGTVTLRAFHQGGKVVIELEDDGGGMNRDAILKKAVANGIVTDAQAAAMPDDEVWPLIFHAGLSTAKSLSDVSGRGVGMDVVRKNIEALRGTIQIRSTPGKGSCFTVKLPLTLAIIDAVVVEVGQRSYIIPTLSIQRFLRPTPEQIYTVQGRGEVISVRDDILPLHRLYELLDIQGATETATEGLLVIASSEGENFALLVDDLRGQQQVVIKSMPSESRSPNGVAGAAILGDGTVGLILDIDRIARLARAEPAPVPAAV